jgi:tryptophanyl-tRNA synthetase
MSPRSAGSASKEAYAALSARSADERASGAERERGASEASASERRTATEGSREPSDDPRAGGSDAGVRCTDAADWLREHREGAVGFEGAVESLEAAGKEPVRPRVRFLGRNATEEAFEALIDAIDGEKRVYEGHVDAFELDRAGAEDLAREVEVDNGGYGFYPPSSIYHRFMTGLTGGKMSSSVPASHISLLDDPEEGHEKVMDATTAGGETIEEHRKYGGDADECPVYELYAYLLSGDDDEFAKRVYDECVTGERLCGDCKEQAAVLMREFLEDHQEKREEAEELLEDLDFELESPRRRG